MSYELNRIELAMLYCIVNYRRDKLQQLTRKGYSSVEASEMVDKLGITTLWGNHKVILQPDGEPLLWNTPTGQREVPDGIVNRFIVAHKLGTPLFYSTQFYRAGDKLADAGFLVGQDEDQYYFAPRESARIFVDDELAGTLPEHWPVLIEVEAGKAINRLTSQ